MDFGLDSGSNAFVSVPDDPSLDISGDFSVAFWYNATSAAGGNRNIIEQYSLGDGFFIYATSGGNLQFLVDGASGIVNNQFAGGFISDGNWHHVVATRSGNDFQMYVDGVANTASTSAIGTVTSTQPLLIGGTSSSDYEGKLDEVRVYTRALSGSDVSELYNYSGSEIIVTTTNDTVDGTTTDVATLLANQGADGFISLREAILAVNNDSGTNWTINVAAGTYSFTSGSGDSGGDFDIRNSVTISGAGIGSTVIDANANDRVFQVHSGTVRFEDMTIEDGGGTVAGTGIYSGGTGDVTVEGVRFFDNTSSNSNGGALYNASTLTVIDSIFDSNSAVNGGGGAIYQTAAGVANITGSLFVGNSVSNAGGGAISSAGTTTITNSTFSGNSVSGSFSGSAINVRETVTLQNVTITQNTGANTGAVRVNGSDTLNIRNTIIAENTSTTHNDLSVAGTGTVNDLGNNLIGDGTGQSDLVDGVNGNQVGTSGTPLDPMLSVLADNGGPTWTHALLAGSTAIDAGTATGGPASDQRGTARDGSPDIGAYEYVSPFVNTFTVINTNDSGAGSLRQAILDANASAGHDLIDFNIAGAGVHTIAVDSALDLITDSVELNATTQAGGSFTTPLIYLTRSGSYAGGDTGAIVVRADNTTVSGFIIGGWADEGIEIDGSTGAGDNNVIEHNWVGFNASGGADGVGDDGILVSESADNNIVRNNVVGSSGGDGIHVRNTSDGNWVWGNIVGLATDGTTARGNIGYGIHLSGTTDGTTIGTDGDGTSDVAERNVIASNTLAGIYVDASTNVTIAGNYIGVDSTGNVDRGNATDGIFVTSSVDTITIGGSAADTGNVVSGNADTGIEIDGADNVTISGNIVGLGADGTTIIANDGHGIMAYGTVTNITIGGNTAAERNVISGNVANAVGVYGGSGWTIQGNYIGTDDTGLVAKGNEQSGIAIVGVDNVQIGGTNAGEGNVLSGNLNSGVYAGSSDGIIIEGNYIGVGSDGVTAVGNADGVHFEDNTTNAMIGGSTSAAANVIAYSSTYGVFINGNGALGNTVRGNRIFRNGGLGIDLIGNGPTPNDSGDGDTGPNNLQNWAVMKTASIADDGTFSYEVDTSSFASGTYTIDFYASTERDGGNVEGERYLGTGGFVPWGNASFSGAFGGVTLAAGEYVTALITDSSGNTSEFSNYAVATDSDSGGADPSDLQTTATTGGGLSINQDGGNDIFLQADDGGALLGGLTSLTYETRYSTTDSSSQTLVSYATSANDNEFKLVAQTDGDLTIQVGTNGITIGDFDFRTLNDGAEHTVSFTWDSSGGIWYLYIDGVEEGSGVGLASGQTIAGGGTLVIGNEQDTPGGGFDPNPYHSATIHDARLFGDVRTEHEIAASYQSTLPYDEAGMLANWRFDDLSTDGVITDSVSGNNLTVKHIAGTGFTASEASLTFSLDENSIDGTVVGAVTGIDAEREALIASLLAANPNLHYSAETGKFYEYVDTGMNWTTANSSAQSATLNGINGQLVAIESADENQIVVDILDFHGGPQAWHRASDSVVEGEWRRGDQSSDELFWQGDGGGTPANEAYSNWDGSNPNDSGGNQDYAKIFASTGLWDDVDGTALQKSIIEYDADAVLDATQALTYSITSQSVSGAFEVDTDSGEIRVADGTLLDADTLATHTITIRTTDVDSNTYDEVFTISLSNLVEANNAPTDLSSGIELNTDGGNDAYLIADDGDAIVGGASEITLEFSFATESTDKLAFLSYRSPTDVGNNDDALRFQVLENGRLRFVINGNVIDSTVYDYRSLADGEIHQLSASWDNTNGDWVVYVDGQLVDQGTEAATMNETVRTGGTLLFSQEQDSVGGGFDDTSFFSGSLFDIRIWDEVRSEAEIALNYQNKFDSSNIPSGLVANWQMEFNGSNEVVDIVSESGTPNRLSIGHASGTGFTTSTPVEDLHINENAVAGASVGFVVPSDPDTPADIVSDGQFLEADSGSWSNFTQGQTFGGWTVESGAISHTSQYESPSGGVGLELQRVDGDFPSAITQTLTTEVGRQYQLVFNMTGNFSGGDPVKTPGRLRRWRFGKLLRHRHVGLRRRVRAPIAEVHRGFNQHRFAFRQRSG